MLDKISRVPGDDQGEGPGASTARVPGKVPGKFQDPDVTAKGEARAKLTLAKLETLWINTGTLCNLACETCYIESSPRNDRLAYMPLADVTALLDEIEREGLGTSVIGFTGGEPFMNPDILAMLETALARGFNVLVLTNAMRPMERHEAALLSLKERFGKRLQLRVSIDHYTEERHERERGEKSWAPMVKGITWLHENGFAIAVAGRDLDGEGMEAVRAGFAGLFGQLGLDLNAQNPEDLVLFPQMDEKAEVPEITQACWGILGVDPAGVMCSSSRMAVRRKGAARAAILACTLLPYDPQFELGHTLKESFRAVALNHPHCAKFCVLGGARCSG